jgi:uncharacterized protein YjbI with pentapeptide repeats
MFRLLICVFALTLVAPLYGVGVFSGDDGRQHPYTTHIVTLEKKAILLKDGLDLSNMDLRTAKISRYGDGGIADDAFGDPIGKLKNIKFDGANLDGAMLQGVTFINCSFKRASLKNVKVSEYDVAFVNCDFTDAAITDNVNSRFPGDTIKEETIFNRFPPSYPLCLPIEQLKQTLSFKRQQLYGCTVSDSLKGADLSCFNLKKASFSDGIVTKGNKNVLEGCELHNAAIAEAFFHKISREQLMATADFKNRYLYKVHILIADLSGIDLSRVALIECVFGNPYPLNAPSCDLKNASFTDAVITGCCFACAKNLTVEQIKSTWNYKVGNMNGIKLPPDIQKALDAEKKESGVKK